MPRYAKSINDAPTKISEATIEAKVEQQSFAVPATVTEKVTKETIKFKAPDYDEKTQAAVYKIRGRGGIVTFLKSEGIIVFDKQTGNRREMRYCDGESSIWKDEQSDVVVRTPLKIRNGMLVVTTEYPALRKFLDMHPDNIANGGSLFFKEEKVKQAEQEIERDFLSVDAIGKIRSGSVDELMPVIIRYGVNPNQSVKEVKRDLLIFAKKDPAAFLKHFDDPMVKLQALVKSAIDWGVINTDGNVVRWTDTGNIIITAPVGLDPVRVMAEFLTTDQGVHVLDRIQLELSDVK